MNDNICVFLRGINTGGVKIKMDELKKAFHGMSFADAATILATGNVVISGTGEHSALKQKIEEGLSRYFGYEAFVFLRGASDIAAAVSKAGALEAAPDTHIYCLICQDETVVTELDRLFYRQENRGSEAFYPLSRDALWTVPVGETLSSGFGSKILGSKKYKNLLTSRNINTMEKILGVMGRP